MLQQGGYLAESNNPAEEGNRYSRIAIFATALALFFPTSLLAPLVKCFFQQGLRFKNESTVARVDFLVQNDNEDRRPRI
jgi:hypothetical protein